MRWEGHTAYGSVGIGSAFNILATPQIGGAPPDVLIAGVELWLILAPDEKWVRSQVIEASPNEIIIEMDDGARWRMTPTALGEFGSHHTITGMHAQDWTIRAKA